MLLIFGENDKKPNSAQKKELTRSLQYLLRKRKKNNKKPPLSFYIFQLSVVQTNIYDLYL